VDTGLLPPALLPPTPDSGATASGAGAAASLEAAASDTGPPVPAGALVPLSVRAASEEHASAQEKKSRSQSAASRPSHRPEDRIVQRHAGGLLATRSSSGLEADDEWPRSAVTASCVNVSFHVRRGVRGRRERELVLPNAGAVPGLGHGEPGGRHPEPLCDGLIERPFALSTASGQIGFAGSSFDWHFPLTLGRVASR